MSNHPVEARSMLACCFAFLARMRLYKLENISYN
jgi:hypothetical protein